MSKRAYLAMLLASVNTVLIMKKYIVELVYLKTKQKASSGRGYYISLLWMTGILS